MIERLSERSKESEVPRITPIRPQGKVGKRGIWRPEHGLGGKRLLERSCYVGLSMLFNIVVSILLVSVNKSIFFYYDFNYGTFITLVHFVVCSIGLRLCMLVGILQKKPLRYADVFTLSFMHALFVTLNNLSLQYNSVGFYQVMKAFTIPLVVVIQSLFYGAHFSSRLKLSLACTCMGIGLATFTDVELNFIGSVIAVLGEFAKAASQVLTGTKHKELGVNSMQLLYYQAPLSSMFLVFLTPAFDNITGPEGLFNFEMTGSLLHIILLSSILAFVFNLSNYFLIDLTGPLTYNVMGHFKTIIVIFVGYLQFNYPITWTNSMGILLSIVGLMWYTQLKLQVDSNTPPLILPTVGSPPSSSSTIAPAPGWLESNRPTRAMVDLDQEEKDDTV